jgi:hypothetical protein
MERYFEHLERIGDLGVAAALSMVVFAVLGVLFFLIPSASRLAASIAALAFCQAVDKLQDLGLVVTICKIMIGPLAIAVGVASLIRCRFRLRSQFFSACWLFTSVWGVICVLGSSDFSTAVLISILWVLVVLAATLASMTVTTQADLELVLRSICLGSGLACVIAATSLFVGEGMGAKEWTGRFAPYGANPNQIGTVFVLALVFGLYFAIQGRSILERCLFGGIATIAMGELLLSLSRASILIGCVAIIPLLARFYKRPILLFFIFLATGALFALFLSRMQAASLDHVYASTERAHHWQMGLNEVWERPLFGLMSQMDVSAIEKDWNAHNAFIHLLYIGGVSLAGPLLSLYVLGLYFAVCVALNPKKHHFSPSLLRQLALLLGLFVAHGFVNEILFYPTYAWSFLAVFLCFLFYHLGTDNSGQFSSAPQPNRVF